MARVEGCSVAAIFSSRKGRLLRLITRSISDVMTRDDKRELSKSLERRDFPLSGHVAKIRGSSRLQERDDLTEGRCSWTNAEPPMRHIPESGGGMSDVALPAMAVERGRVGR